MMKPKKTPSPASGRGSTIRRVAVGLMTACLLGAAHAGGYDVRDDTGQTTHFDTPPMRVISLLPSLTETVCALNACDRLVGVDRYSNWPAAVQKLPQLGGGLDPSIEAVVALKPDVVLMAVSSRASLRLRGLGLKVVALEPKTLSAMRRVTETVGQVLQVPGAQALLRQIDADVQAVAASLPAGVRGQRVYFEVTPAPHAAGRGTFIDELMGALGLVNIIDPALGPYPKINPELVVRADPDLIMISQGGVADVARRPGWAHLRALRGGQVCPFNPAQRDILIRAGPRMAEAARLMADCAAHRLANTR